MFKFTTTNTDGKETKDVDVTMAGWLTIGVAFIAALAPVITSIYSDFVVTNPNNEAVERLKKNDQELEKQKFEFDKKSKEESQLLEKQKFQSELFQSALQGANPKQRA